MAYKASWYAPAGDLVGSYNQPQVPHNIDNYQEKLRLDETIGYFKPPHVHWPYGGYSKKEAKNRLKKIPGVTDEEPVVKAGTFEKEGTGNSP